jgi:flagellar motor switch protein FliM
MAGQQDQIDQDARRRMGLALDSEDPAAAAEAARPMNSPARHGAAMGRHGRGRRPRLRQPARRAAPSASCQEEIDSLLGFSLGDVNLDDNSGIRAIIDSAMVSYERLPMLEIVFDRLVRLMTTSLAQFHLRQRRSLARPHHLGALRRLLNSIPLPAILSVFKAEEWDNFGLFTVDSSLIYSIIDVLLGGRRGQTSLRIEGRPYTTIETNLVKRMVEVVLADAEQAFRPLSPVTFNIDRLETNPRFAAISRPPTPRSWCGCASTWKTAAAISSCCCPTRPSSRSATCCCRCSWARSSAAIRSGKAISRPKSAQARSRSMPCSTKPKLPLKQLMKLKSATRCRWRCARRAGHGALRQRHADRRAHGPGRRPRRGRVTKQLRKPKTTFAMFEKADEQTKLMEAQ